MIKSSIFYKIFLLICYCVVLYFLCIKIIKLKSIYDIKKYNHQKILNEIDKIYKVRDSDFYKNNKGVHNGKSKG